MHLSLKKYEDGGEVTDACIEEVVNIFNSIQKIRDWFVTDGKLVIVFEDELMTFSVEQMNYNLEQFTECHDVLEPEVNLNYGEDYKSIYINLKKDDMTIGKYADGGTMDVRMEDTVQRMDNPNFADISYYKKGGKIDDSKPNYGKPNVPFSHIPFIHETDELIANKILVDGFKLPTNPHVTKGVYTTPIVYKNEKFNRTNKTKELSIWLKDGAKIFWTNSERPTDYYLGYGNKFYQKLYDEINLGHKTPKDDWNNKEYQQQFCRRMEKWLKDNGYAGVQQGGEIVITDLSAIDYVELFNRENYDLQYKRGGKTSKKIEATGDCYYSAGQFIFNDKFKANKIKFIGTPYLVHAEVQGQGKISHLRYGHAWVEDDSFVYDYSNQRELVIPKFLYYAIGDIKTNNPLKYRKYTFDEASKKMLETGNYGCWDLEVEYNDGGTIEESQSYTSTQKSFTNEEIAQRLSEFKSIMKKK